MDVIIATGNKGKLKEFKALLGGYFDNVYSVRDFGLDCDAEETGATFEENALIKARYVKSKTDMAVLADDSGLQVKALGGAPGVYSARYAGEDADDKSNRAKLFVALDGVKDRRARFVSVVVLITADGRVYMGKGDTQGVIMQNEEGENGFGYDAMFWSDELQKSFGVATEAEKNSVSHRSKAVRDLIKNFGGEL